MIKVKISKTNSLISNILITGHSDYSKKGSDIVCAGVSAVGVGGLNSLIDINKDSVIYKVDDGYLSIDFPLDKDSQIVARVMEIQLQSIYESYSKYIKITLQEVKEDDD